MIDYNFYRINAGTTALKTLHSWKLSRVAYLFPASLEPPEQHRFDKPLPSSIKDSCSAPPPAYLCEFFDILGVYFQGQVFHNNT